jgi:hypothetical protein
MCFSASASFLASGVLSVAGVVAYAQTRSRRQLLFASIPFLFAIQQAAEGVVWLSFSSAIFEPWRMCASYFFLVFAFVVWPVWVPLAVYCYEPKERAFLKKILIATGGIASLYLAVGLMVHAVLPRVLGCHILYSFPAAHPKIIISSVLYVCATIGSFLISSAPAMNVFGVLVAIAYAVSAVYYYHVFVSVWCFFAALLSAGVVVILYYSKRT